jgi:hypothetical protein
MGGRFSKSKKTRKGKKDAQPGSPYSSNRYSTPKVLLQQPPVEKPDFQALFDYDRNGTEDISMRKHDLLKVIINE